MRAFVIDGPASGAVVDVPEPEVSATDALVDVSLAGLCGTDVELFAGTMPYLREGLTSYPVRPGHEWVGTVRDVGSRVTTVEPGDRVVADTFQGCGRCDRCDRGRHHLCEHRVEMGVRGNRPGALSERVAVPATALHRIPHEVSDVAAALVEPASCALRAVRKAHAVNGATTAVWGTGTIGLLCALFARALGGSVSLIGERADQFELARRLGFDRVGTVTDVGSQAFDSVIDTTGATTTPALALDHVSPGGHLALVGVAPQAAPLDANIAVLHDVTVVGVLGGSAYIDEAIALLASGDLDVKPLIATTVCLDGVADVLRQRCRVPNKAAPKVMVDLRLVDEVGS